MIVFFASRPRTRPRPNATLTTRFRRRDRRTGRTGRDRGRGRRTIRISIFFLIHVDKVRKHIGDDITEGITARRSCIVAFVIFEESRIAAGSLRLVIGGVAAIGVAI